METHIESRLRVGVVGGSGYTGRELLSLLATHVGVEVAFGTSRSEVGEPTPVPGVRFAAGADVDPGAVDLLFLCLPHGEARRWMARVPEGVRVVDLTADHRPGSGTEDGAVYGLPERHREEIRGARLVANPGCYPTAALLALAPLHQAGWIRDGVPVTIDAASGVTGAGRSPRRDLLFAEVHGDYRAYGLGNGHRHLPEMRAALCGLTLLFTPHLLPLPRGILETIHVPVRPGLGAEDVTERWAEEYRDSPVVRVGRGPAPCLSAVVGTDRLDLAAYDNAGVSPPVVTVVAALDNLGKGAAGQAVQNMNLMAGWPEGRGLRC